MNDELGTTLKRYTGLISARLKELVFSSHDPILYEAASYSLEAGKRLRPLLVLLTAKVFGCPIEKVLDPACAIELVHCYSLIHDDLPCMDDDDLRRGRPTLHKVYGDGIAVLTGDFLLTHAFEVIGNATLEADEKAAITSIVAKRAGGKGMIAGQMIDLACEDKVIDLRKLYFMHWYKTASLITAALEVAGVLCKVNKNDQKLLYAFGKRLGLAYQTADDIADASSEDHSDAIKKKATVVSILGLVQANNLLLKLKNNAITKLQHLSISANLLKEFTNRLLSF